MYRKGTGEQMIGPEGLNVLAINDVEFVVGVDAGGRAARWSPVTYELEVLAAAGMPWYINDRNETVGQITVDSAAPCVGASTRRPAFWGTDGAQALPGMLPNAVEGVAFGINNDSVAVGMVETPAMLPCEAGVETIERAVLWKGRAVFQLDTLVEADAALHLISATSINDAGEILAQGYVDDEPLRPCPGYVSDPSDPSAGQVCNPDLMCRSRRSFLLRPLAQ